MRRLVSLFSVCTVLSSLVTVTSAFSRDWQTVEGWLHFGDRYHLGLQSGGQAVYAIAIPGEGQLTVELHDDHWITEPDLDIALFSEDGEEPIATSVSGDGDEAIVPQLPQAGRYVVQIKNYYSGRATYHLSSQFEKTLRGQTAAEWYSAAEACEDTSCRIEKFGHVLSLTPNPAVLILACQSPRPISVSILFIGFLGLFTWVFMPKWPISVHTENCCPKPG